MWCLDQCWSPLCGCSEDVRFLGKGWRCCCVLKQICHNLLSRNGAKAEEWLNARLTCCPCGTVCPVDPASAFWMIQCALVWSLGRVVSLSIWFFSLLKSLWCVGLCVGWVVASAGPCYEAAAWLGTKVYPTLGSAVSVQFRIAGRFPREAIELLKAHEVALLKFCSLCAFWSMSLMPETISDSWECIFCTNEIWSPWWSAFGICCHKIYLLACVFLAKPSFTLTKFNVLRPSTWLGSCQDASYGLQPHLQFGFSQETHCIYGQDVCPEQHRRAGSKQIKLNLMAKEKGCQCGKKAWATPCPQSPLQSGKCSKLSRMSCSFSWFEGAKESTVLILLHSCS